MDFIINNAKWKVKKVTEDEMKVLNEGEVFLGLTDYTKQEIYLLENQANILKTLKHELMHVWMYEYGHNQHDRQFTYEDVCEIVSSSIDFINEKVDMYTIGD